MAKKDQKPKAEVPQQEAAPTPKRRIHHVPGQHCCAVDITKDGDSKPNIVEFRSLGSLLTFVATVAPEFKKELAILLDQPCAFTGLAATDEEATRLAGAREEAAEKADEEANTALQKTLEDQIRAVVSEQTDYELTLELVSYILAELVEESKRPFIEELGKRRMSVQIVIRNMGGELLVDQLFELSKILEKSSTFEVRA